MYIVKINQRIRIAIVNTVHWCLQPILFPSELLVYFCLCVLFRSVAFVFRLSLRFSTLEMEYDIHCIWETSTHSPTTRISYMGFFQRFIRQSEQGIDKKQSEIDQPIRWFYFIYLFIMVNRKERENRKIQKKYIITITGTKWT